MFEESDERRFERLYNQHHDRVAAYLLSRTDRESAQDALFDRIAAGGPGVAEDGSDQLAERQLIAQALSRLTESEREAVLLIAWDGLSHQEAAIVLGCSRVAVTVRVHRARQRLTAAVNEITDTNPLAPPPAPRDHRTSNEADRNRDLIKETP